MLNFETVYRLCNKHQWFTDGSNTQYDKMEIAKMIVSCKSVGAVKAIMTLFDIASPTQSFYIPQNANNSVSLFLNDESSANLTTDSQKEVYKSYMNFL